MARTVGRDAMLKKNQQRLKEKRRAKRMAESKKKKTESKPERAGFGERTPLSGGAGGTRPTGPAPKRTPKREVRNGVIYIDGKKVGYTKDHSSSSGGGSQQTPQRPPQTQQQTPPRQEKPPTEKPPETRQLTNGGSNGPKRIPNRTAPQGGYTISPGQRRPGSRGSTAKPERRFFKSTDAYLTALQKWKKQQNSGDSGRPSWVSKDKWKWLNSK